MPVGRNLPCEVRFHVTPEMHEWLKAAALKRGDGVAPYLRSLIAQDMERIERAGQRRSTDPLIEEIAKKMGVELP